MLAATIIVTSIIHVTAHSCTPPAPPAGPTPRVLVPFRCWNGLLSVAGSGLLLFELWPPIRFRAPPCPSAPTSRSGPGPSIPRVWGAALRLSPTFRVPLTGFCSVGGTEVPAEWVPQKSGSTGQLQSRSHRGSVPSTFSRLGLSFISWFYGPGTGPMTLSPPSTSAGDTEFFPAF